MILMKFIFLPQTFQFLFFSIRIRFRISARNLITISYALNIKGIHKIFVKM